MNENDSLPEVRIFRSLDEIPNAQKDRFFEFLNDSIGGTFSEIGTINGDVLKKWGTERLFLQENLSGRVIGAGLLLKSGTPEDCLTISGLCYDKQLVLSGQRIMKSIVTTWKSDFSCLNLSVDISKDNGYIKRVAEDLGFIYDQASSDDSWSRFLLSAHVKMDSGVSSIEASFEVDNTQQNQSEANSFYKCELCQKKFVMKYNLKKHRRTVHAKEMFWCYFCEKSFKLKSVLKRHVNYVHENR
eukprot:188671_1